MAEPHAADLRAWLRPDGRDADLFVIGVQEASYKKGGGSASDWFAMAARAAEGLSPLETGSAADGPQVCLSGACALSFTSLGQSRRLCGVPTPGGEYE